jgi:hypothetical protein
MGEGVYLVLGRLYCRDEGGFVNSVASERARGRQKHFMNREGAKDADVYRRGRRATAKHKSEGCSSTTEAAGRGHDSSQRDGPGRGRGTVMGGGVDSADGWRDATGCGDRSGSPRLTSSSRPWHSGDGWTREVGTGNFKPSLQERRRGRRQEDGLSEGRLAKHRAIEGGDVLIGRAALAKAEKRRAGHANWANRRNRLAGERVQG